MKINIIDSRVTELYFSPSKIDGSTEEMNESLKGSATFKARVEFSEKNFFVVFALTLHLDEEVVIKLGYKSRFETDNEIDEEFKSSNFPYVNAPAIAYPFLRAFVANITLSSGYAPVMLPSVNFVAMKDKVMAESGR
ncbi:protein-export chaperone SecB [Pseudomonas palleroniana]|uniref:Preprotein translocase subunit SecB n=1 Tax=Pseudomonas palleroniana TaxID=191390 RepID=A0A0X7K803_9PSED|nr:protein-export chaperone SecB [Pseudomonas palleroniana]KWU51857.1 hypothetical protein AWV77_07415 [Pseudomonas palleroniana]